MAPDAKRVKLPSRPQHQVDEPSGSDWKSIFVGIDKSW